MWYKNVGTSFFRFITIYAFDRRTDGQTDGHSPLAILCVALHAVARLKWLKIDPYCLRLVLAI